MTLGKEKVLVFERESTISHSPGNWLWKRLCICRKTDCTVNDYTCLAFRSQKYPVKMLAEKRAIQIGFLQLSSISSGRHTALKYAAIINIYTGSNSKSSKPSPCSNRYLTDTSSMLLNRLFQTNKNH
jgi:hypothetical protein